MAQVATTVDHFLIGVDNYTAAPYQKNGNNKLGGYKNRNQYCWEAVQYSSLSSIPAGSTITAVDMSVHINSYNSSNTSAFNIDVRTQDKGSWADNGVDEPSRTMPAFFDSAVEYTEILSYAPVPIQPAGAVDLTVNIPSTTQIVSKFQGWLDGTITNDGYLITYYPEHFSHYIIADAISYTITYDPPSGGRRRLMIM